MLKIQRLPCPMLLTEHNAKNISQKWKSSGDLYEEIKSTVMEMTQEHCSFCDAYPVENSGDAIEHFKPKSDFPDSTYEWENLFYICTKCNTFKGNQFTPLLLKPDVLDYAFEKYFHYNSTKRELEARKDLSDDDKKRVAETINHYKLNREAIRKCRKFIHNEITNSDGAEVIRDLKMFRYIYDLAVELKELTYKINS